MKRKKHNALNVRVTFDQFMSAVIPDPGQMVIICGHPPFGESGWALRSSASRRGITGPRLSAYLHYLNQRLVIRFGVEMDSHPRTQSRMRAFFTEGGTGSARQQHRALDAAPLQPSIRVEAFGSVQAYWLIEGPCNSGQWRGVQARLAWRLGTGPHDEKMQGLLHLPAFDDLALRFDYAAGRMRVIRKPVRCVEFEPSRRYTVEQMREAFPRPILLPNRRAKGIADRNHQEASAIPQQFGL